MMSKKATTAEFVVVVVVTGRNTTGYTVHEWTVAAAVVVMAATPRMAMLVISSASIAGVGGLRDYSFCLWSDGHWQNVLPSALPALGPMRLFLLLLF